MPGSIGAPSKAALTERHAMVIPISQSRQARLEEVSRLAKVTELARPRGARADFRLPLSAAAATGSAGPGAPVPRRAGSREPPAPSADARPVRAN